MYRSVNEYHRALENPRPWSGPRRDLVVEEYRTEKDRCEPKKDKEVSDGEDKPLRR